jgi:transposase-like protein
MLNLFSDFNATAQLDKFVTSLLRLPDSDAKIVLFKLTGPDGASGVYCAKLSRKSARGTVNQRVGIIHAMRRRGESPVHRAMRGTRKSEWEFEILEVVPKGKGGARKTELIEQLNTYEPNGMNVSDGSRKYRSLPAHIRKSEDHTGSGNPRYNPKVSRAAIIEAYRKLQSMRKVAATLGLDKTLVKRVLQGKRFKQPRYDVIPPPKREQAVQAVPTPFGPELTAKVKQLRGEGYKLQQIADLLKISKSAAFKHARKDPKTVRLPEQTLNQKHDHARN